MTLTEFLTARLDEDEAVARAGLSEIQQPGGLVGTVNGRAPDRSGWTTMPAPPMLHRALLDVEAKRRIVEPLEHFNRTFSGSEYQDGVAAAYEDICRLLALPYADHPDYDEAWRP